jgi:hypothetical protein
MKRTKLIISLNFFKRFSRKRRASFRHKILIFQEGGIFNSFEFHKSGISKTYSGLKKILILNI